MALRACPLCGYRYNAPENQTCGKCRGWMGASTETVVAAIPTRKGLLPRSLPEVACYLVVPLLALFGWPLPFGALFGLLMAALLLKVVRLDMERFSKGLLAGIVIAGIFCAYLLFVLLFSILYSLVGPALHPLVNQYLPH